LSPDAGSATDREVALECARIAHDRLARDVKVLKVGDRLGIADWFVLATVNNSRQARAVRDAVRVGLKDRGAGVPISSSEDPEGRWSLFDYGGVVLHLFDDEGRQFFDLDSMWADAPEITIDDADRPGEKTP
jgi:ribosome-associated protein